MRQEKSVSLQQTNELLWQEEVTIYEAAIQHEHCFDLVDVLEKKGNRINLIEVKSGSWEPGETFTYARSDFIRNDWQQYLFDVAFQTWVIRKALPGFQVEPYLMLIDKTQKATVDGLHQFFRIKEENGRNRVEVKEGVSREDLGEQILRQVYVGDHIERILNNKGREPAHELEAAGFDGMV